MEVGCFPHAKLKFFELADVEGAARRKTSINQSSQKRVRPRKERIGGFKRLPHRQGDGLLFAANPKQFTRMDFILRRSVISVFAWFRLTSALHRWRSPEPAIEQDLA